MKVMVGDNFLELEVCQDHEKGLSGRDSVKNDGMVFIYPEPIPLSYHMKDCNFALDIIFCKEGQVMNVYKDCQPCKSADCQKYNCELGDLVIELPAGKANELCIKRQDLCQIV